jgi:hypothetical protein
MTLPRLMLTFNREGVEIRALYRTKQGPNPGTKARRREITEIADAWSRKLSETERLVGLHTWLESSGQWYIPGQPTAGSIEHLLHERRRELGLLDVGVVG